MNTLLLKMGFAVLGTVLLAVILCWVFSGVLILSPSFSLGFITIHYYGLIIALAILCAWWLAQKNSSSLKITKSQTENIFLVILISGFVGARIYHVLTDLSFYLGNPLQILYVWNGGLGIFGGVMGGLLCLYIYNRKVLQNKFWAVVDWLIPSVVLGQVIGRFGNMFNYELYGVPTNLPWKMFVPQQFQTTLYEAAQYYFHPLFLYESLAGLLILFILLRYNDLSGKLHLPKSPGSKFLVWLILYGIVRFFIELLRVDHTYIWSFNLNLLMCTGMVVIGLAIYIKKHYESKQA